MHYFSPFYSSYSAPFLPGLMLAFLPFLIIAALWTVAIKGYALWHAARNSQKWWFVALLFINTLGILEVIYLIWFRPTSPHFHKTHSSHTPEHESSARA